MSTKTTNYGFTKPELTDAADITATNENWDALDEKIKELDNHTSNKSNPHGVTASQVGALPLTGGVLTGQGFYLNNKTGRIVGNENGVWIRTASSDVDNNTDARHLKLWNATYVSELVRSFCIFDTKTNKDYIIYGQHNVTSGTTDLTAGKSSLATGAIYRVYE